MDASLQSLLKSSGISEDSISVLEEEGVVSLAILTSLREEHFEKLLPNLKVGQHALIMKIWDLHSNWRGTREVGHLFASS